MHSDHDLRELAEQQHGVVSREQCRELGLDRDGIRADRRAWKPMSPRVLRLVGAPKTDLLAVMAAVLDAGRGACASHRTAAGLWRLPGFGLHDRDVSRLHGLTTSRSSLGTCTTRGCCPPTTAPWSTASR